MTSFFRPGKPPRRLLSQNLPKNLKGILLMLVASIAASCMSGVIIHLSKTQHPFEVAFFRNVLGLFMLAPLLAGKAGMRHWRTDRFAPMFWRGVFSVISMLCFFYGVSLIPLAESTALQFTAPIFATIIAILFLGERIRLRRTLALFIGILGALIILRPGFHEIGLGAVLMLASAVAWSVSMVIIKILTKTESAVTQSIYTVIMLTPITGIAAVAFWRIPTLGEFGWMIVMAGLGTSAQLAFTEAFKEADLGALLPLDFTKLIWSAIVGYMFFAQTPDIWVFIGGGVIFASATYISVREARLKAAAVGQ